MSWADATGGVGGSPCRGACPCAGCGVSGRAAAAWPFRTAGAQVDAGGYHKPASYVDFVKIYTLVYM